MLSMLGVEVRASPIQLPHRSILQHMPLILRKYEGQTPSSSVELCTSRSAPWSGPCMCRIQQHLDQGRNIPTRYDAHSPDTSINSSHPKLVSCQVWGQSRGEKWTIYHEFWSGAVDPHEMAHSSDNGWEVRPTRTLLVGTGQRRPGHRQLRHVQLQQLMGRSGRRREWCRSYPARKMVVVGREA